MDDVRATLEQLIRDRREDYVSLSRLLGRNAAYVQQFIHRGIPRKLAEDDRRTLARYFDVDEVMLGAPADSRPQKIAPFVLVPRLQLGASAGPGAHANSETPQSRIGFEAAWLRTLSNSPNALSIIQVAGDSMSPTLADGDDILVDREDGGARVRDGIYVLRIDDALLVKRLAVQPTKRRFAILSDNSAYPSWPDIDPADVELIGRVIWTGRKIN
jgi:phage repressor protein C with HTH and peptisase S24 domain